MFCIGSPLKEVLDFYSDKIDGSSILDKLQLIKGKYIVASIHREENLDIGDNFKSIIDALNKVVDLYDAKLIFSAHPRTKKKIEQLNLKVSPRIRFVEPLGFCDYVFLQKNALITLSDSGTISEEASILNFRALNIREAHERPEAMEEASVMMVGLSSDRVLQGLAQLALQKSDERTFRQVVDYSMPNVSEKVVRIIISYTSYINSTVWKL